MSDVGKIVMCITLQGNKFLTVGTAYEVEQDVAFHYTVKNDRGVSTRYSKECFEEIPKETEKQKIKVLCVDLANYSYIIKGKLYEAEDYNTNYYQLVNDEGDVSLYRKTCFVTSNEATPIKPPLGLIPRKIYWEELNYHRRQDIIAAMQRRMEAKMDIPVEWCKELIDLVIAGDKNE
jgi:hypothetical protein